MQKQRKRRTTFRRQSLPHRSRKMSFERIEVSFQGSVRAFIVAFRLYNIFLKTKTQKNETVKREGLLSLEIMHI